MIESLSSGAATESDRTDLSRFICGNESDPFVAEIHRFVRSQMLDLFLAPSDPAADLRLVTFRGEPGHRLVAVAAHASNSRVADQDGELLPGTELMVVAVALAVQGDSVGGESLLRQVMRVVIEDVAMQERGDLICCLVHQDNAKMVGIVRDAGVFDQQEMASDYLIFTSVL